MRSVRGRLLIFCWKHVCRGLLGAMRAWVVRACRGALRAVSCRKVQSHVRGAVGGRLLFHLPSRLGFACGELFTVCLRLQRRIVQSDRGSVRSLPQVSGTSDVPPWFHEPGQLHVPRGYVPQHGSVRHERVPDLPRQLTLLALPRQLTADQAGRSGFGGVSMRMQRKLLRAI